MEETIRQQPRFYVEERMNQEGPYSFRRNQTRAPLLFATTDEAAEKLCTDPTLGVRLCNGGLGFPQDTSIAAKTKGADGTTKYYFKPGFSNFVLREWGPGTMRSTRNYEPRFLPEPFRDNPDGYASFLRSIAEKKFGTYQHEVILGLPSEENAATVQIDLKNIVDGLAGQIDLPTVDKKRAFKAAQTVPLNAEDVAKELKDNVIGYHQVSLGHIKDHPEILVSISLQPNMSLYKERDVMIPPPKLKRKGTTIEAKAEKGMSVKYTSINDQGKAATMINGAHSPIQIALILTHRDQHPCFDHDTLTLMADTQKKIAQLFRLSVT